MRLVPGKIPPPSELGKLTSYNFEVSWGGLWVSLNDEINYRIHPDTGQQKARSYRQIKTSSPIVEGDQLIHAVPDMVVETIKIWVYGQDMADFEDNMEGLEKLFEQFSFNIRVTKNNHREVWKCQMATQMTQEKGHVWMHHEMGIFGVTVPRYPTISRERIDL